MYTISDLVSGVTIHCETYDACLDQMTEWQELEHLNTCDDECMFDDNCTMKELNHYRIAF